MQRLSKKEIFAEGNRSADIARKSVRGGVSTIGAQVVKMILRIGATVVLARLLTPADYGLIGMVTVVVNFAGMFKDAGLSMATIQKDQIRHEQISNLFWINVLISIGLGLCVFLVAPLVAWFYEKPELTNITAVLSISFILSGLAIQHAALLRRHMRFGELAFVQVFSQLMSVVATVIFALYGFSYWALVGGTLVGSLLTLLLTYYFCPWVPGKIQRRSGSRDMLKFGGHLTGANLIGYLSRNADNILIGRFIGADALGLYSRAYSLFMFPVVQIRAPIQNVASPILAALQGEPQRFLKYYKNIINLISSLSVPITIYCFVESELVIYFLLGEQWMGAVPIFRILSVAGLLQSISGTYGLVMIAMGFSERYLRISLFNGISVISSFVIGLPFGVVGVALAYVVCDVLLLIPKLHFAFRGTPVTVSIFMKALALPALIGAGAAGIGLLGRMAVLSDSLVSNAIFGALFFVTYTCLTLFRPSVQEAVGLIRVKLLT